MDDDYGYVANLSDGTPALLCWKGVGTAGGQGISEYQLGDLKADPVFAAVFVVLVFVPLPPNRQAVNGGHVPRPVMLVVAVGALPQHVEDAGIVLALIGYSYRGVADVQLAGDDVGDEAGAVLVHEADLSTS